MHEIDDRTVGGKNDPSENVEALQHVAAERWNGQTAVRTMFGVRTLKRLMRSLKRLLVNFRRFVERVEPWRLGFSCTRTIQFYWQQPPDGLRW